MVFADARPAGRDDGRHPPRPRPARRRCHDRPAARPDHRDRRGDRPARSGGQLRGRGLRRGRRRVDLAAYDGVWRYEVTYQDGLDAGLPADEAGAELGVQTVRLDGGTFRWDWRSRARRADLRGHLRDRGRPRSPSGRSDRCGGVWDARPQRDRGRDQLDRRPDAAPTTTRSTRPSGNCCTACRGGRSRTSRRPTVPPEGVYRWEVDEDDLLAAGVDGGTAYHNSGLMTMTIEGGRWLHHTESAADPPDCGGTYEVQGTRVAFTADATRTAAARRWSSRAGGADRRRHPVHRHPAGRRRSATILGERPGGGSADRVERAGSPGRWSPRLAGC